MNGSQKSLLPKHRSTNIVDIWTSTLNSWILIIKGCIRTAKLLSRENAD